jgi:hypothetical protein
LKKDIIKYLFAEYRNCISGKDDAALESKQTQTMSFYKMGTVTTEATLDLGLAN